MRFSEMKTILSWICGLFSVPVFAQQVPVDTLFLGNHKIPLVRVDEYYDILQEGPVFLPSEYKGCKQKDVTIDYSVLNQVSYQQTDHWVYMTSAIITSWDSTIRPNVYFPDSVDTLYITPYEVFFRPYINTDKQNVCSIRIKRLRNDTLTNIQLNSTAFDLRVDLADWDFGPVHTDDLFYLDCIYYRKGSATWFLDLPIIIKITEKPKE